MVFFSHSCKEQTDVTSSGLEVADGEQGDRLGLETLHPSPASGAVPTAGAFVLNPMMALLVLGTKAVSQLLQFHGLDHHNRQRGRLGRVQRPLQAAMLSVVLPIWKPSLALLALGTPEQGCLVGEQTSSPKRSPAVLWPVPSATCSFPGQTNSGG